MAVVAEEQFCRERISSVEDGIAIEAHLPADVNFRGASTPVCGRVLSDRV